MNSYGLTKRLVEHQVKSMLATQMNGWEWLVQEILEEAIKLVERFPQHLQVKFNLNNVSYCSLKHPGLFVADQDSAKVRRAVRTFDKRFIEPVYPLLKQGLSFGNVEICASKQGKVHKYTYTRPELY